LLLSFKSLPQHRTNLAGLEACSRITGQPANGVSLCEQEKDCSAIVWWN